MRKKVHKPPSKIKYDNAHPTISIRVTRELYDQLNGIKEQSGKSLGDILREAMNQQAPSIKDAYQRGYKEAKDKFAVVFKCSVCGGNTVLTSDKGKALVANYLTEQQWGHADCFKK